MDFKEEINKAFPVGQKFYISNVYHFQFTGQYNRGRYKIKLLEKSTLDFTGQEFMLKFKTYKIIKNLGKGRYMVRVKL